MGREPSFTPYWFHGLQQAVIKLAPAWLISRQARGACGAGRAWKGVAAATACMAHVALPLPTTPRLAPTITQTLPSTTCKQVMSMHQGFRARFYRRQAQKEAEGAAAAGAGAGSEGEEAPKRELRKRK